MSSERIASKLLHQSNLAILCSSAILRKYGMGQIDIAYYKKGLISLVEVKSAGEPSLKQIRRIKKSAEFISAVFNIDIKTFSLKMNSIKPNLIQF